MASAEENQQLQRELMATMRDGLMELMRLQPPELAAGYFNPLADALAKVLQWQRADAERPSSFRDWYAVYREADDCYELNAPWLQEVR